MSLRDDATAELIKEARNALLNTVKNILVSNESLLNNIVSNNDKIDKLETVYNSEDVGVMHKALGDSQFAGYGNILASCVKGY